MRFRYMILAGLIAGCAPNVSDHSTVLARFDGTTVTQDEFNKKIESLPKALKSAVLSKKKDFIEEMAAEHYLLKEAERRGLEKQPDVRDLIQQARKKIIVAKLVEIEVDKKISLKPEEAKQYYESHPDEFMTPLMLKASHILVRTRAEAEEAKVELDAGADFEELARKKSLDATAIRGGDLGFFQKGRFVREFEDAVFKMKKGEISDPVETQFGYHIIKLTDRLEPTLRDFRAVRRIVEEQLLNAKRSKLFKELVHKLKDDKKIEFNEKALAS